MDLLNSNAFQNVSLAIDRNRRFPENVFLAGWTDFAFFDSDLLFDSLFVEKLRKLFEAEGGTCVCMLNLDEVANGKAEQAALFIDREMTGGAYQARLGGENIGEGWLYNMDRFGFASDLGQWCIYCEKGNEMAVIAIQEKVPNDRFSSTIKEFNAVPIKQAIEKPIGYGFSPRALSPEWRDGLLKAYSGYIAQLGCDMTLNYLRHDAQLTQQEIYGKWLTNVVWVILILLPVFTAIYCTDHYRLVNADNAEGLIALITSALLIPIMAIFRKELFPWGSKLSAIQWLGMIALCAPASALAVSFFLFLNVRADGDAPFAQLYTLTSKQIDQHRVFWHLTSEGPTTPRTIILKVTETESN
jgi:hypothetical protein